MNLIFASPALETLACSATKLQRLLGSYARKACQRLCELAATDSLAVALALPTLQLQALKDGRYALPLGATYTILFEPITPETRFVSEEGLACVTSIRILAIGGQS